MKAGPAIAPIAALAGDPARANMLAALMGGQALTASELAEEAGVTLATASSHLSKLESGGLISAVRQGRHRYFRLADSEVAAMLEKIMEVAARAGHMRTRPGPSDPALRQARVCYDHLAGEFGVALYDFLTGSGRLQDRDGGPTLTRRGETFFRDFGVSLDELRAQRRPLCKACLDWSMRRHHLSGSLGAAMLTQIYTLRWATPAKESRAVLFSRNGRSKFFALLAR
jgi:DNA-binding transcriptional ArsR family regulator